MTARLPPVTWLALAFALGIGLGLGGLPRLPWPLIPLLLVPPVLLWWRPTPERALLVATLAGAAWASAWLGGRERDCRLHLPDGQELSLLGRFEGRPGAGGGIPFQADVGFPGGCRATVRTFLSEDEAATAPSPGIPVRVRGRWRTGAHSTPLRPELAGYLAVEALGGVETGAVPRRPVLRFRGSVQERIASLYGDGAPMVDALLLARRESLDPELREAFALSGTAHLLAISGFHVGVIAALLFGLARIAGARREGAALASAVGSWGYVLAIGVPYAAARAATIVSFLAVGRIRGRPVDSAGALSSAFLLLLLVDPGALASVGFQLSFAGAAGLVLLYRPVRRRMDEAMERVPGSGYLAAGTAAGVAATLPTLPLVAWHFGRATLAGIPVTLIMAPLVSTSLPGILASLVLDLIWSPLAGFLAGGVTLLLDVTGSVARTSAALPGVAPWVPRHWFFVLPSGAAAGLGALRVLRRKGAVGRRERLAATTGGGIVLLLLWPALPGTPGSGDLEIHVLEVGQGDALAVRSPAGRWLLVDAGPWSPTFDAGERRVVPHLRRAGVRRLEAVVMTHPHLDHIGGVQAVMDEIPVQVLVDPGWVAPSRAWLRIIERVRAGEAGWWAPRAGDSLHVDGLRLEILHPREEDVADPSVTDANEVSIVILLTWGRFVALLTGDAYREVEIRILPDLPRLDLLKLGHHGSRTSTASELLTATRPRAAAASMGRRNLYGHPHREVTGRLDRKGIPLWRTDRHGTLRIRADRAGRFDVRAEREGTRLPLPAGATPGGDGLSR